jgi:hypothetical protein
MMSLSIKSKNEYKIFILSYDTKNVYDGEKEKVSKIFSSLYYWFIIRPII